MIDACILYIYKVGFGLVNILAYDHISEDLLYNYYLHSDDLCLGSLYSAKDNIISAQSDARYLRESLGLDQGKNAPTTIKACMIVLNAFVWSFIISIFIHTLGKLYSESSIKHYLILSGVTIFQVIFLAIYFYIIHKSLERYWQGESNYIDIRIYLPLTIFAILAIPIPFFSPRLCAFIPILLLSIIFLLPVFPLYLVIAAKGTRKKYRDVI